MALGPPTPVQAAPNGGENDVSAEYRFRVAGRLTPRVLQVLEPLAAGETATDTVLVGQVADRAALHGFIARIEALDLELVELKRLPSTGLLNGACPRCGRESEVIEGEAL
jgi:hypothetical protein